VIPEQFQPVIYALVYILVAPILGGLIAGIDRKVTARMRGACRTADPPAVL